MDCSELLTFIAPLLLDWSSVHHQYIVGCVGARVQEQVKVSVQGQNAGDEKVQ